MRYPLEGAYQGLAVRSGRPAYVARVRPGGPFPTDLAIQHGVQSFCTVPLVTPRRTLGTLDFGSLRPDAYTAEEIDFMEKVAGVVAVAIENAMNLETVREQQAARSPPRGHQRRRHAPRHQGAFRRRGAGVAAVRQR
jgi:formate hydrogenlyase transcriptional activator